MDEKADLYTVIATKAKKLKSLYSATASDRRELLNHLDINNWYGLLSRQVKDIFLKGDSSLPMSKGLLMGSVSWMQHIWYRSRCTPGLIFLTEKREESM